MAAQMRDLKKIFYDALVIEIDFTDWNDKIVLGVIACSASMVRAGRQRTFLIEFHKPSKFECEFAHYATRRRFGVKHFAWRIGEFELLRKGRSWLASFRYSPDFPKLSIACETIRIREVKPALLDAFFSGWNKPGSGLCSVTIAKIISEASRPNRRSPKGRRKQKRSEMGGKHIPAG